MSLCRCRLESDERKHGGRNGGREKKRRVNDPGASCGFIPCDKAACAGRLCRRQRAGPGEDPVPPALAGSDPQVDDASLVRFRVDLEDAVP